jgi:acyl-CoA synthetase (AMP-forming)/AMP-acid ligase II
MSAILTSVYAGRRIVQLPTFEPNEWVRLVRKQEVTHAMVVPTMLARIIEVLEDGKGLPSMRHLSYGGGRMPLPVIEQALELLPGVNFVNAYGLTETSSSIAVLGPDDHREALESSDDNVRRRLGSVGRPLPTVEISIRDFDGNPLPQGEHGEVWVRGEQVSGEYAQKGTNDGNGWFATKDGGYFDEGGYLFVEGRIDDVIVRGGENLSPGEIEDVLLEHPAVTDAVVFGIPDVEWGEVVAASVVLHQGRSVEPDELKQWVTKHLRSSRAPAVVQIRSELPYNDTGKVLRRVLRDEFSKS